MRSSHIFIQVLFTFLLFSISADAQSSKSGNSEESLRKTFLEYFKTVEEEQYEQTLDYIYPKLFDMVPREMMLQVMQQMNADTTMNIKLDSSQIQSVSEIMKVDQQSYAKVNYTFRMVMQFFDMEEEEEVEGEEGQFDFMAGVFEGTYGKENVRRDAKNHTLFIHVDAIMIAFASSDFEGWKFLEKKENLMPMLKQMVPEKVLEKL